MVADLLLRSSVHVLALKSYTPSILSNRALYFAFSVNVNIYLSSCEECAI